MSEFILKARDLNKFYTQRAGRFGFGTKTVKALDNVSLELRHASTLAVAVSYTHLTLPTKRIV